MQTYLYIGLAIAVYIISVIKTYGLGYDRGFDAGLRVEEWTAPEPNDALKQAAERYRKQVLGNSQPEEIPYLEDTKGSNYEQTGNPW